MNNVELLGVVSFCVLMQNRDGIMSKAPSYISKKYEFIKQVPYMWDALDDSNRRKVFEWGKHWKVDFETLIEQISKDYNDIPSTEFRQKYTVK